MKTPLQMKFDKIAPKHGQTILIKVPHSWFGDITKLPALQKFHDYLARIYPTAYFYVVPQEIGIDKLDEKIMAKFGWERKCQTPS